MRDIRLDQWFLLWAISSISKSGTFNWTNCFFTSDIQVAICPPLGLFTILRASLSAMLAGEDWGSLST